MLDYNKLANEIDEYLDSLDKEFIHNWYKTKYPNISIFSNQAYSLNDDESYEINSDKEIVKQENAEHYYLAA